MNKNKFVQGMFRPIDAAERRSLKLQEFLDPTQVTFGIKARPRSQIEAEAKPENWGKGRQDWHMDPDINRKVHVPNFYPEQHRI